MYQQQLSLLPSKPGVYIFKNNNDKIIYIGKAKNLKKRVSSYFLKNKTHDTKTELLISNIYKIEHIVLISEIEAFLLEANLIKKNKPFYNVKFLDDKFYPYVKITKGSNPYISISRKKDDKNSDYFGPYPHADSLRVVLKLLRRIFPYQSVKNHPKRVCLYHHLNLCPCILVHPESREDYKKNLKNIKSFLEGKKDRILIDLLKAQKKLIKDEEFEKASELQNKIESINKITSSAYDPFSNIFKKNYYKDRVSKEIFTLKATLSEYGINTGDLKRIECYDVSNLQGKNATASMVVFDNGDASKKDYRKFKIKSKSTPNDFHMLSEVIKRRLSHSEWEIPNLMLIDGGKGQVGSVLKTVMSSQYKIPVIGLAKKYETIVIPEIKDDYSIEYKEIKLPKSNPSVNLLRRIRDEAHRFALSYHIHLRSKLLA